MAEFLNQDWFKSLATAGAFGTGLMAGARLIEVWIKQRVPSVETQQQGEQSFRGDLIERVKSLEGDRDRLVNESITNIQRYSELASQYEILRHDYDELKRQHEAVLEECRKLRERVETLTKLSLGET